MKREKWTRKQTELFVREAQLDELEKGILETRIAGMTIKEQALYFSLSESSVSRVIARIKELYDMVQKEYPEQLPIRYRSKQEEYMDEN